MKDTPPGTDYEYMDRGWPFFEKSVTDTKSAAALKIFSFSDCFDPDHVAETGVTFLLNYIQGQAV